MPMPEIEKQVGDRITYKPFVAKVTAHSQYNDEGFGIEGVDGFWKLGPSVTDLHPELGKRPPIGAVAMWTLQMAPVQGKYAGPGKFYRDVIKVDRVDAAPQPVDELPWDDDAKAAVGAQETAKQVAVNKYDQQEQDRRTSIEQQVVLKADAEVIAAALGTKAIPDWLGADAMALIVNRYIGVGQQLAHGDFGPLKPDVPESSEPEK